MKSGLIYPENPYYTSWNLIISIMLIFSCCFTPVQIALFEELNKFWSVLNIIIDICFFIDVIVTFNLAIYNDNLEVIEDRFAIAKTYLTGWFFIDVIAIVPFSLFIGSSASKMVRVVRLGRISKILKLLKLLRLFKLKKSCMDDFEDVQEFQALAH